MNDMNRWIATSFSQRRFVRWLAIVFSLAPACATHAQTAIPIRQVTHIISSDSTVLMGLSTARSLPDGSVLINDPVKRQLVLFDSTLRKFAIIADTSTSSPNSYGLRPSAGGLIPYVADSSLFIDSESQAFLVIDPHGAFVRVMAPVRASDLNFMANGQLGFAGFDTRGRLLYRTQRRNPANSTLPALVVGRPRVVVQPDSAPIMRMDFDKATVDTLGTIKVPVTQTAQLLMSNGGLQNYAVVNPLPSGDEWTLLPDGTVAIVRAQDYHIDWLSADGKLSSSPKMPFDWKRISTEDKQKIIDSVKLANAERVARAAAAAQASGAAVRTPVPFVTVEPGDLPDFYPPVRQGQVRSDHQGNVWILPSTSAASVNGGLLYDVVNRDGAIVERVQLPAGRTLVGFAESGAIFMHYVKSARSAVIERGAVQR
ncbi:MAG: hypothetical protein ABJB74_14675 [Gemmatimonas sp.]